MGRIQTILGDIKPGEMGVTYSHEHLMTRPPNNVINGDVDLLVDDPSKPRQELAIFKAAGGETVVEMTPRHYGRNLPVMVEASRTTGVHVIACSGWLKGAYFPRETEELSKTQLADIVIREVTEGMDGTRIKAGVVKAGTMYNTMSATEEKVLRAVAIAAKETGALASTHTEKGTMGVEQVEVMVSEGLDPSRIAIGHIDQNIDPYIHLKIVRMGAYVLYDGFSKIKYGPDAERVSLLRMLREKGYGKQILISCDMGRRSYWKSYGGGPGFDYILKKFLPRLLDEGFPKEFVDDLILANPHRAFAIEK
ncbi:MAG: phosphotriesterase-related protein [Firmicutes bacterium]|nr:phosphotriesterase-related protein [Bacillota bacterium]